MLLKLFRFLKNLFSLYQKNFQLTYEHNLIFEKKERDIIPYKISNRDSFKLPAENFFQKSTHSLNSDHFPKSYRPFKKSNISKEKFYIKEYIRGNRYKLGNHLFENIYTLDEILKSPVLLEYLHPLAIFKIGYDAGFNSRENILEQIKIKKPNLY